MTQQSKSLEIREDAASRRYLAKAALVGGFRILGGPRARVGLVAAALVAAALWYFNWPEQLWSVLVFLAFPVLLGLGPVIYSCAVLLPQQWNLSADQISGRGVRFTGKIPMDAIRRWHLQERPAHSGPTILSFKWSRAGGLVGASHELLLHPGSPIRELELLFRTRVGVPVDELLHPGATARKDADCARPTVRTERPRLGTVLVTGLMVTVLAVCLSLMRSVHLLLNRPSDHELAVAALSAARIEEEKRLDAVLAARTQDEKKLDMVLFRLFAYHEGRLASAEAATVVDVAWRPRPQCDGWRAGGHPGADPGRR